ncbi:MAG: hypothetical protein LRY55_08110, partial [Leadbetterella sp.]|nr:hypothetical protein [Leadbetterella sp.]
KEYWHKTIMEDLVLGWGVKYYASHTSGFWVSFKLSIKQLVHLAEEQKRKNLLKRIKDEIRDAKTEFHSANRTN